MEIKSLKGIQFNTIYSAFENAFSDYDVQINKDELFGMLKRRGFCNESSFAAFDGNKIVAFTLNGVGHFNNLNTAYDTGTGTTKEYRGQGLASKIFEYSLPYLKEIGIKQYLLEVLQHNKSAIKIYKNMGFNISREFNYYIQDNSNLKFSVKASADIKLDNISLSLIEQHIHFFDFIPSWQNSIASIKRDIDKFILTGAFKDDALVGFSVFEPVSGDVTQLAVAQEHRRQGVGSLLLQKMQLENNHNNIKLVNTQIDCSSIADFLKFHKMKPSGKQFEMIREV